MRSSGLPILISDVPGLSDLFSNYNGVFTFKAGSKDSLKKTLNDLLNDLSNNNLITLDLSSDLKKYSIQNFLKRYEEYYKKLKL